MTTPPSRVDRLLGAYPLVLAYVALLIALLLASEQAPDAAGSSPTSCSGPISRGALRITASRSCACRTSPFSSLYAYLIAPAWWASTSSAGYAAAKYINVVVMTASLFPAFALARLFVPRLPAIACGIATAAIPAFYYTGLLIPEPLAYFWACLTLWLVGRALLNPTRRTIAAAVIALVIAPAVRSELTVLILTAIVGGITMAATSDRGRELVGSWSWRERIGAAVLVVGFAVFLGAAGNHHSYTWQIGAHFHHRMFTYGLWAVGSFTIGIGILPVLVALAWLLGNRFRTAEDRALGGLLLGAVLAFGLYTAVKASYLSTNFAIRVEERNLIYVAPVVFAVLARWAISGRIRIVPLLLSGAAVWYLLDTTPLHNTEHLYSDAPGLAVLQWLNQKVYFTTTDADRLLYSILAGSIAVVLLLELGRRRVRRATSRAPDRLCSRRPRHRLEPLGRDSRCQRLEHLGESSARRPSDAAELDRQHDRQPIDAVHRPVACRIECVLVARVLESVDPLRLVGRRKRTRPGAGADPELPRHERRDRPAASGRLDGRGAGRRPRREARGNRRRAPALPGRPPDPDQGRVRVDQY